MAFVVVRSGGSYLCLNAVGAASNPGHRLQTQANALAGHVKASLLPVCFGRVGPLTMQQADLIVISCTKFFRLTHQICKEKGCMISCRGA